MIKNTEVFYTKAKEFQDKRSRIVADYEADLKRIEAYKGSEGYTKDLEKITEKRDSALEALRGEYRPGFNVIIDGMTEAIGKRTVSAPTNEQINLLNALRMRKKVSQFDLQRVAESVKDNPIALGIVTEISRDQGYLRGYDHLCKEMSSERASEIVTSIRKGLADFMEFDTSRASRLAKRYNEQHYGITDQPLPKRKIFSDREGCFREIGGIEADTLKSFSDVVDV